MPYRFTLALLSPVQRLDHVPGWGWLLAILASAWQYLSNDAFSKVLALVIVTAALDYWFGVKAAKLRNQFRPVTAQMGLHGKMSGVALLILIRLFEGWAQQHQLVALNGGLATAIAVALLTVDLQSIVHHRESFGAAPIPILGQALAWLRHALGSKFAVPAVPAPPTGPVLPPDAASRPPASSDP